MSDDAPTRIGHFKLGAALGRGGMGVVYRATDEKLGREVAIKLLAASASGDTQARARMLREARAAASITHRNIVTVYEIGEDEGRFFIAMEMVRGGSLRTALQNRKAPMSIDEALHIARAIASALSKAHAAGVIHRDLKPDNVLLADDGEIKLADFGIAKLVPAASSAADTLAAEENAPLTVTGSLVGTPGYMAPEAFGDAAVDARADLFALGVVLYELLANRRLFRGESVADTIRKVLLDDPPALHTVRPEVPPSLEALVVSCLEKSPAARIRTADAFIAALDGLDSREPTVATRIEPTPSPTRTRRLVPAWAAIVPLALIAGSIAVVLARKSPAKGVAAIADASTVSPLEDEAPAAKCTEAARVAYRDGMRALRDVGTNAAGDHFAAAVIADPRCAVAHLRVAMSPGPDASRREAFERALSAHADFGPREAAIASALAPELRGDPPDPDATARALVALADARSADAELQVLASNASVDAKDAQRFAERACAIDPSYAGAWDARARAAITRDDPDAARESLDQCAAHAPANIDCVMTSMRLAHRVGDCAKAESLARQYNLRADGTAGFAELAFAASTLEPDGALVVEAIDQWERRMPFRGLFVAETWRVGRKVLVGDFLGADADLSGLGAQVKSAADLDAHVRVALLSLELLVERGDVAGASRFAADFLSRTSAWNRALIAPADDGGTSYFEGRMRSLVTSDRASRAQWDSELAALHTPAAARWAYATAIFARTPDEAREAMKSAPPPMRIPYGAPNVERILGETALASGDAARAAKHLERATERCSALTVPFDQVRASLALGKARDALGVRPNACAAYATVLARWGKANARSVTADEARVRSKSAACAP